MDHLVKSYFKDFRVVSREVQRVWKLFNLVKLRHGRFTERKATVLHMLCLGGGEGVLHLKVWHFIWKRKQTKIALLSDYTDRFCMARWALWNQYHFRSTACGIAAKIHSWPAGDLLLLISNSEEQDFPPPTPPPPYSLNIRYINIYFFNILYVFCMKKWLLVWRMH